MRKTFSYKADINKETELNCSIWIERCRRLYNTALEQRIILWNSRRKSLSYIDQTYEIKHLRKAFPEYAAINSQVLQDPLKRVDLAFKSFYKRCNIKGVKSGFPKFKSRGFYRSLTFKNSGWNLEGKYLEIYNVGKFKLFLSRPIQGTIKTVTVRKSMTNKWFVSFSCDDVSEKLVKTNNNEISLKNDGKITTPPNIEKSILLLEKRRKVVDGRKKNSNRRSKARLLIEKAYEKIVNQRKDYFHKLTTKIIEENDTINIIQETKKEKKEYEQNLLTTGWYIFVEMLTYKVEETKRILFKKKEEKNVNK